MLESALALAREGRCAVFIPRFIAGLHNRGVRRARRLSQRESPPGARRVRRTVQVVTRVEDEASAPAETLRRAVAAAIEEGRRALD